MARESLELRIRGVLGINPTTDAILKVVADWLKDEEAAYREEEMHDEAHALRDLRVNLISIDKVEVEPEPVVWVFQHAGLRKPATVPGRWATEQEARTALLRYFRLG